MFVEKYHFCHICCKSESYRRVADMFRIANFSKVSLIWYLLLLLQWNLVQRECWANESHVVPPALTEERLRQPPVPDWSVGVTNDLPVCRWCVKLVDETNGVLIRSSHDVSQPVNTVLNVCTENIRLCCASGGSLCWAEYFIWQN